MTSTTYTLSPAPKFSGMKVWDCTRCGREEVKPVFLAGPGGVAAYGSGCAAVLLGRPASSARRIKDEYTAIERREREIEEMRVERMEAYGRAVVAFEAREDESADLLRARKTYHNGGGFAKFGTFGAWVKGVAQTGEIG